MEFRSSEVQKFRRYYANQHQQGILSPLYSYLLSLLILTLFTACSVDRFVGEDEYFLKETQVVSTNRKATKNLLLDDYILQTPNSKWFGAKIPLKIYCLGGVDTTNWATRLFRKIGQDPVIYDQRKAERTIQDLRQVMYNEGYMHTDIQLDKAVKGKKINITYIVDPGTQFTIRNIRRNVDDPVLEQLICQDDTLNSLLRHGMPFNINRLNEERSRISTHLRTIGYYKFYKELITFVADTCHGSTEVDITMNIPLYLENNRSTPHQHQQYRIGKLNYFVDTNGITDTLQLNCIRYKDTNIYYSDRLRFRPHLLTSNTLFHAGDLYNEDHQKLTYRYLTRLRALSYSNIKFEEHDDAVSPTLDCNIIVNHAASKSINFDLEGTNSAGDLGIAASTSIQHRNLFRASESLTVKLRGAYEAITGLEGYEGHNYIEWGGEATLGFPGFLMPAVSKQFGAIHSATSEISLQYNMQNRPEFNRRVLTAAWRYKWNNVNQKATHRFDLLEINYVYMPWMSRTFKEQYLDSLGKTNAILKYNYENLLITKLGYTYAFNSLGTATTTTYGKNAYTIKFNIETAGNLLEGVTDLFGAEYTDDGKRKFCGIAYAQYVKGDFDFSKSFRIDKNNSVAFHAALGIAYPYGNSNILPFEKRYFAGGANSVRGWSVRSLGPGAYNGADRGINFINQSGDLKLDLSIEYRAFLFWKFNGALFIDAGNIWTIRDYADQPGGAFRLNEFYKQIAVAYGLGLRMNLDFFILRFDAGMKAINPAYQGHGHYPIAHPVLSRDFSFHFAVGLPF
ncbi:MAG: BamA/TamA family outer membrane protein [Bacteroidaceae bacterium]|nr:BamA/TamA family outer membrane protein [Bacteroidaceae bacterium]